MSATHVPFVSVAVGHDPADIRMDLVGGKFGVWIGSTVYLLASTGSPESLRKLADVLGKAADWQEAQQAGAAPEGRAA